MLDMDGEGPARLLDLDEDNGTVIVKFQGKPYLMSMRHIRPFRGHFFMLEHHELQEQAMRRLQKIVEHSTPYRCHGMGKIYKKNSRTGHFEWSTFPEDLNFHEDDVMKDVFQVSQHFSMHQCHGLRYGRALKTIHVPVHSKAILLCWPCGSKEYVVTEHLTDHHISLKKEMCRSLEEICFIYLYYDVLLDGGGAPLSSTSRQQPQSQHSPQTESEIPMETEEQRSNPMKRDGPETRTVVIGQEKKRQRLQFAEPIEGLHLHSLWWMLQRPLRVNWDPLNFYDLYERDIPPQQVLHFLSNNSCTHDLNEHITSLFCIPCRTEAVLHVRSVPS